MTGSTYLIELFPKSLALTFGTQNSDFERSCTELLFNVKRET